MTVEIEQHAYCCLLTIIIIIINIANNAWSLLAG